MTTISPVFAAQYLRMSTEHQQYSLDNQASAILRYATANGCTVVKTYTDAGKGGLNLKNRAGLSQLLKDVVGGTREYAAILVYDVSRWGRFQDADEAAHYEFFCKQAGIPVHYCAESFANDGAISSTLLKALKRSMATRLGRGCGLDPGQLRAETEDRSAVPMAVVLARFLLEWQQNYWHGEPPAQAHR